jgi:hypothetical protein
LIIIIWVLN